MAFGKFFKWLRERRLSIRTKLILSLSSIAAILLVSLLISVMEYSGMSNYVSDLIADDILYFSGVGKIIEAIVILP